MHREQASQAMASMIRSVLSTVFKKNIRNNFPGTMPVSINQNIVSDILPFGYVCSLKADGVRVLTMIHNNVYVTIKRDMKHDSQQHETPIEGLYLFDSELLPSGDVLLFDALVYDSRDVLSLGYLERHELVRRFLARYGTPALTTTLDKIAIASGYRTATVRINGRSLSAKRIYNIMDMVRMWEDSHLEEYQNDGLIFTLLQHRYTMTRTVPQAVLKWKPPGQITVDFRAKQTRNRVALYVYDRDQSNEILYARTYNNERHSVDEKIVEAKFQDGAWSIIKVRTDKLLPNDMVTLRNTIRSIDEAVSFDNLREMLHVQ